MTKAECRKLFLEKRNEIADSELQSASDTIILKLLDSTDFFGKTVSVFLPISEKREINTFPLLDKKEKLNTRFALPVADFRTSSMLHLEYENRQQITISTYGIPEPTGGKSIIPGEIDLVIVPLLCFDLKGYRVGYGKGFYDRFLSECRPDCQFIGLSLFEPVNSISDTYENDVPLHLCITPEKVYRF